MSTPNYIPSHEIIRDIVKNSKKNPPLKSGNLKALAARINFLTGATVFNTDLLADEMRKHFVEVLSRPEPPITIDYFKNESNDPDLEKYLKPENMLLVAKGKNRKEWMVCAVNDKPDSRVAAQTKNYVVGAVANLNSQEDENDFRLGQHGFGNIRKIDVSQSSSFDNNPNPNTKH